MKPDVLQLFVRGPRLQHLESNLLRNLLRQVVQLVLKFLTLEGLLLRLLSVIGEAILQLPILLLLKIDLLPDVLNEHVKLCYGFLLILDLALLLLDLLLQVFLLLEETLLHLFEDSLLVRQFIAQFLFLFALLFEEFVVLDALVCDVLVSLILQVLDLAGPEFEVWVGDGEVTLVTDVVLLRVGLTQVLLVLEASGANCLAASPTVVPGSLRELLEAAETQRAIQLLLLSFLELISLDWLELARQEFVAFSGLELGQLSLGAAFGEPGRAGAGAAGRR